MRAREAGADAVLVHHGIFWDGMPRILTGVPVPPGGRADPGRDQPDRLPPAPRPPPGARQQRPGGRDFGLDEPGAVRRSTRACRRLQGPLPRAVPPAELVARCRKIYGQEPLAFLDGPDPVRTLGIVSGGAQREVYEAIAEGLDAYITGEVSEWVMNVAREAKIHYLACGPLRHRAAGHPGARRAPAAAVRDRGRVHRRAEPGVGAAPGPDPSLSADLQGAGGLDPVIFQVVAPFWRDLRAQGSDSCLWLVCCGSDQQTQRAVRKKMSHSRVSSS